MNQNSTVILAYSPPSHGGRRQRKPPHGGVPTETLAIPRLARLLALAIHLEQLLEQGVASSQAELARLGHVTRARLTQIISLRQLAPDIQEEILFLPPTKPGHLALTERHVRPLLRTVIWSEQRRLWAALKAGRQHERAI
jgi:hypothetical protein